jgi:hypothetical protein
MDYFREFYGTSSSSPKPSLTIAYKSYPQDPKFYGKIWFVYGNFMEQFPPPIFMAYKPCAEARKFYGKVWIVFRNFMEIPPTALGHHSPLLISLIPGARNFMELYGLFMEILWKNLAPS